MGVKRRKKAIIRKAIPLLFGNDVSREQLLDGGFTTEEELERIDECQVDANRYLNFLKAKSIGVTINLNDLTPEEIDIFYEFSKGGVGLK